MRKALNDNPVVQAAAIGILALVVGFLVLTRLGGGADPAGDQASTEAAAADPAAAAPVTDGTAAAPATTQAVPADSAAGVPTDPAASAAAAGTAFEAGPGLPKAFVEAYESGDTVALLVLREHPQGCYTRSQVPGPNCSGIDDRKLEEIVRAVELRPSTEVFVTHAFGLSRYSRIAQGVEIDRAPALIVLQPEGPTSGALPAATISYGFRGPESVLQAFEDAEYAGPADLPYYPE